MLSDGTWISKDMGGWRLKPGGCQDTLSLNQDCNLCLRPINTLDWKIEVQKTTLYFFSMNYVESVKNGEGFLQLTELKSSWKVIIHCQILLSRIKDKDHLKWMLLHTSKERRNWYTDQNKCLTRQKWNDKRDILKQTVISFVQLSTPKQIWDWRGINAFNGQRTHGVYDRVDSIFL